MEKLCIHEHYGFEILLDVRPKKLYNLVVAVVVVVVSTAAL